MKLGFVGTGTMGVPIARHLLAAGHALTIFDVVPGATRTLVTAGASRADALREVADAADTLFLSLPGPQEIESVTVDLAAIAAPGTTIIDLSTNSVECARTLATRCAERQIEFMDAPVSGGVVGAERGTLSVMVGASDAGFARARPLLETFAKSVFHVGPAGAGALAKLVNNQIFLCASVLIQEGFVLGAKAGMDANTLKRILDESSAGLFVRKAGFMLSRDFDKAVFKLGIAEKDVAVALESARALGVDMPLTSAAHGVYRAAVAQGLAAEVFSATLKVLESLAGVKVAPLES
jgi:3-hydroxyisobutyrate dehydrogenase-like beta-hydroxyacid dehydrogenase